MGSTPGAQARRAGSQGDTVNALDEHAMLEHLRDYAMAAGRIAVGDRPYAEAGSPNEVSGHGCE
jgi:hypothetical protein